MISGIYGGSIFNAFDSGVPSAPRTSHAGESVPSTRAEMLEVKLERSNLLLQTLLMILLEKKVIQEDEFREWLVYVDQLDGARDGRVRENSAPILCPQCMRNSPRLATKCLYCGEPFTVEFLARRSPTQAAGEPSSSVPEPPQPPQESGPPSKE